MQMLGNELPSLPLPATVPTTHPVTCHSATLLSCPPQIVNPGVGEGGQALEACLTPDGHYVLSGNPDRSIRAWRVQVGGCHCNSVGAAQQSGLLLALAASVQMSAQQCALTRKGN